MEHTPSINDVAALPRWAVVAFAARSARIAVESVEKRKSKRLRELSPALTAVRNTEQAAAAAGDQELDLRGYTLGSHGYRSQLGEQPRWFAPYVGLVQAAARESKGLVADAILAATHAAQCSQFATWAKAASEWDTYGHNAAMIQLDKERQDDRASAEAAARAAKCAVRSGVDATLIASDFALLTEAARREHWNRLTTLLPTFFTPDSPIERQVMLKINDLCVALCELIARDGRALNQIEWRLCERVVATALSGIGFDVQLMPGSKDGGKDVIATCVLNGKRSTYYIEIKHWRSNRHVGEREVAHFVEVNVRDGTEGGLYLSSSGYAATVLTQLAEITQKRIRLGNDVKIVSLCQQFVQRRGNAVWEPQSILPALLFGNTFQETSAVK